MAFSGQFRVHYIHGIIKYLNQKIYATDICAIFFHSVQIE